MTLQTPSCPNRTSAMNGSALCRAFFRFAYDHATLLIVS